MVNNNYNQLVTVTRKINSTKEILWKFISSPGYLNKSHPFCKENNVISWNKNSHIDELIYLNNLKYIREFILWKEGTGYTLLIGESNKEKSKVKWQISSSENDALCLLQFTYHGKISKYSFLPELYIKPKLRSYLNSVIKELIGILKR